MKNSPEGITFEINSEETILEACLRNGIRIEHACEMSHVLPAMLLLKTDLMHWMRLLKKRKIY